MTEDIIRGVMIIEEMLWYRSRFGYVGGLVNWSQLQCSLKQSLSRRFVSPILFGLNSHPGQRFSIPTITKDNAHKDSGKCGTLLENKAKSKEDTHFTSPEV